MADFFDKLEDKHIEFIREQPMFFVATAAEGARINLSPKGMDTFRVIDPSMCAYLDLTGSGNETAAHIKHDGRITFMFNSFGQLPLILRLYGQGRVAEQGSADWQHYARLFPEMHGARQLIFMDIDSVQTSCGYAVPKMEVIEERQMLTTWAERKSDAELDAYRQKNNMTSIDGLQTGLT